MRGIGVAVDSTGNGYITGATYSTDLVTKNAAISTFQGSSNTTVSNAFVAEFDPTAANGPASLFMRPISADRRDRNNRPE